MFKFRIFYFIVIFLLFNPIIVMTDKESLSKLSVSELKKILTGRKVSFVDCVEKQDLILKVIETNNVKKIQKSTKSEVNLGGLECVKLTNGDPDVAVIIMHGYGANSNDLVDIGQYIQQKQSYPTNWYFPNGPDSIPGMGSNNRMWWNINVQEIMMAAMVGDLEGFINKKPEGIQKSHDLIIELIKQIKIETNLPSEKIVLGGFSQGAMLTADVAFQIEDNLGALAVFSGSPINLEYWKTLPAKENLKILQTHGKSDAVLPYSLGVYLKQYFEQKVGANNLEFVEFEGGHTVPESGFEKLLKLCDYVKNL